MSPPYCPQSKRPMILDVDEGHRVECPSCGRQLAPRLDGRYPLHRTPSRRPTAARRP